MDLSHGVEIKKELDIRQEIAIQIAHVLDATIAVQKDLDLALERALDQGILQRPGEGTVCPNCGTVIFVDICPNCNQALADPELLDYDPNAEDREGEDLSDSEDADDPEDTTVDQEEKAFEPVRTVTFSKCIEGCLRDCGMADEDLPLFLFLITELADLINPIKNELPNTVAKKASKAFGLGISQVQKMWEQRPFDDQELMEILGECLLESRTYAEIPTQPSKLLEIRKIGNAYVPLVNDRYEDLVVNTAAKNKWIAVGPSGQPYHANLVLKRKEQTKEILYKILETIIDSRRDFLDAPNREAALEILRTRPFQQKEVVDRHGIDKGVIARHFNDIPILTLHGLFILKDLSQREALEQEDISVPALKDIVRKAIEISDREGKFFSDRKIRDLIAGEGMRLSVRYVGKIRQQLGIQASGKRKKAQKPQS